MGKSAVFAPLLAVLFIALNQSVPAQDSAFQKPLATETVGTVATLPADYPASFVFVSDLHFSSLLDSRTALIDVSDPVRPLRGQIRTAQFGNLLASVKGEQIFTTETFFSRLTRGERTDVLTIWDKRTLAPTAEVVLPGNKRGHFVTQTNALQFTNEEQWALVFNFTPAASVTIVDLKGRRILGEVSIPGCALAYPTGSRGFSTLCSDGSWSSIVLDESGGVASTTSSKPVNDIDKDPWFMIPAMTGRTAWFVTYLGNVRGFDLSAAAPRDVGSFSLVPTPGASRGPRPGGWQVAATDAAGQLFILVNPEGADGTHKDGGSEVWVADTAKRAVARKIRLKNTALSIEVTAGSTPYLVAARHGGSLDVYEAPSGKFLHTIAQAVNDPFTLMASGK